MHSISVIRIQISEWVQRNVSGLHENHHDTIRCHTESSLITHAMSNDYIHSTGLKRFWIPLFERAGENMCFGCGGEDCREEDTDR